MTKLILILINNYYACNYHNYCYKHDILINTTEYHTVVINV